MKSVFEEIDFLSIFSKELYTQGLKLAKENVQHDPECFKKIVNECSFEKVYKNKSRYSIYKITENSPFCIKIKNYPNQYQSVDLRSSILVDFKKLSFPEEVYLYCSKIHFKAELLRSEYAVKCSMFYIRPKIKYFGEKNINMLREKKFCKVGGRLYNNIGKCGNTSAICTLVDGYRKEIVMERGCAEEFAYGDSFFEDLRS